MNARERMAAAMRHEATDRVPVMCQLAIGHYFLHAGLDPIEIWHDSNTFATALVRLQQRYGFDGILVNLPGRDPAWRDRVLRIERHGDEQILHWIDGSITVVPPDDLPHTYPDAARVAFHARIDDVDPDRLHYLDPYDVGGVARGLRERSFPTWQDTTVRGVRALAPDVSVHAEVFSPFTQLLELLDFAPALMALIDQPEKVERCLHALARGTAELMALLADAGADAILISSAFAGAGFISTDHYRRFVLPYERQAIAQFRQRFPRCPVYTHTCGEIGDRLELIAATGTSGIDTLDPPPLGDVELADAKTRIGDSLFIKGNIDPVNTLLQGTPAHVFADAQRRVAIAAPGSGYILSSACSVAPATPPENILQLRAAAEAGVS